jgi:hypothetical protein
MKRTASVSLALCIIAVVACHKQSEQPSLDSKQRSEMVTGGSTLTPEGSQSIQYNWKDSFQITFRCTFNGTSSWQRIVSILSLRKRDYGKSLGFFTQTLTTTTPGINIQTQMKNHSFSGTLRITDPSGATAQYYTYYKGILQGKTLANLTAMSNCTFLRVHNCVSYKIEGMGFFEYAECLLTSVGCYAATWMQCTWDNCF